jgi:hypothetical protein
MLFFMFLLVSASVCAKDTSNIEISVVGGYSNTTKIFTYTPFKVTLKNTGNNFNGELHINQINANDEFGYISPQIITFAEKIEIPSNSTKVFTMDLPIRNSSRKFNISVLKGSKEIISYEYSFNETLRPEQKTFGILTKSTGAFDHLADIELFSELNIYEEMEYSKMMISSVQTISSEPTFAKTATPKPFYLSEDNFPKTWKSLDFFNAIIISNFDISLLNMEQIESLEEYVQNGGTIIVDYTNNNKFLKGFSKELNRYTSSVTEKVNISEFFMLDLPIVNYVDFLSDKPKDCTVRYANNSNYPISYDFKIGSGLVKYTTVPMAEIHENMSKDAYSYILANYIFDSLETTNLRSYFTNPNSIYSGFANLLFENDLFPAIPLVVIVILYLVVISPILYILLKKINQREKVWIIYPIISLIFIAFSLFLSYGSLKTSSIVKVFSFIDLTDSNKADITSSIVISNDSHSDMVITYPKEYDSQLSPILNSILDSSYRNDYYSSSIFGRSRSNPRLSSTIYLADTRKFQLKDFGIWSNFSFNTAKKMDVTSNQILNLVLQNNGIYQCNIDNQTIFNIEDSFIILNKIPFYLGDITIGDKRTLTLDTNLPSGISHSDVILTFMEKHFGYTLDSNYRNFTTRNSISHEMAVKSQIITNNMGIYDSYSARNFQLGNQHNFKFFGFNRDKISYNFLVNEKEPQQYSINLIHKKQTFSLLKGQLTTLPYNFLTPSLSTVMHSELKNILDPNSIHKFHGGYFIDISDLTVDSIAEFTFTTVDNINYKEIAIKWPKNKMTLSEIPLETYIYNAKTRQWQEFSDEYIITTNAKEYVSSKNTVKVKFAISKAFLNKMDGYIKNPIHKNPNQIVQHLGNMSIDANTYNGNSVSLTLLDDFPIPSIQIQGVAE